MSSVELLGLNHCVPIGGEDEELSLTVDFLNNRLFPIKL